MPWSEEAQLKDQKRQELRSESSEELKWKLGSGSGVGKATRKEAGLCQATELVERSFCISVCRYGQGGSLQGGLERCGCRGDTYRASFPAHRLTQEPPQHWALHSATEAESLISET